ncbi:MAG: carboxypeptidase regulatory-like domain-containing protein [Gemmatimonadetes bacterium]|nr:carboxypeptidase regulatory-like domain-containing protein [Gemmatimonadota bacterium]
MPADTRLSLQLQHAGRASAAVDVTVTSEAGAEVRDLSISSRSAATIASLDSIERSRGDSADAVEPLLTGTATVTGIARGSTGLPLANTEIRVRGARSSAVTDSAGRFNVAALPAGTHMLVARHIGYEPTEVSVELRAGRSVERDVQLTRVISLDSVRVVAMRSQYPEFESNRRFNPFGRYLGPDEVERRHATTAMDLVYGIPGVTTAGHNLNQRVVSTRAARRCAGMRIYLDGTEVDYIGDVAASQIGAVEVYVDGAFVPSRYAARGSCGVVVFWSKAARQIPAPQPAPAPASPRP